MRVSTNPNLPWAQSFTDEHVNLLLPAFQKVYTGARLTTAERQQVQEMMMIVKMWEKKSKNWKIHARGRLRLLAQIISDRFWIREWETQELRQEPSHLQPGCSETA